MKREPTQAELDAAKGAVAAAEAIDSALASVSDQVDILFSHFRVLAGSVAEENNSLRAELSEVKFRLESLDK